MVNEGILKSASKILAGGQKVKRGLVPMKKIFVVSMMLVAAFSLAACAGKAPIGKGKAPIVTKG